MLQATREIGGSAVSSVEGGMVTSHKKSEKATSIFEPLGVESVSDTKSVLKPLKQGEEGTQAQESFAQILHSSQDNQLSLQGTPHLEVGGVSISKVLGEDALHTGAGEANIATIESNDNKLTESVVELSVTSSEQSVSVAEGKSITSANVKPTSDIKTEPASLLSQSQPIVVNPITEKTDSKTHSVSFGDNQVSPDVVVNSIIEKSIHISGDAKALVGQQEIEPSVQDQVLQSIQQETISTSPLMTTLVHQNGGVKKEGVAAVPFNLSTTKIKVQPEIQQGEDRPDTQGFFKTELSQSILSGDKSSVSQMMALPHMMQSMGQQASIQRISTMMAQAQQQIQSQKQQQRLKSEETLSSSGTVDGNSLKSNDSLSLPLTAAADKMVPTSYQTITHSIQSQKWGEALGKHLQMAASRDIQKMQITLNPEKLGPIQVRLHMDKDRQLHVNLLANHHMTREAMMDAMPRLREMLESNGVQLANLDVADQGFQHGAEGETAEGGKGTKGVSNGALGSEMSEEEMTPIAVNSSLEGMVDYYA